MGPLHGGLVHLRAEGSIAVPIGRSAHDIGRFDPRQISPTNASSRHVPPLPALPIRDPGDACVGRAGRGHDLPDLRAADRARGRRIPNVDRVSASAVRGRVDVQVTGAVSRPSCRPPSRPPATTSGAPPGSPATARPGSRPAQASCSSAPSPSSPSSSGLTELAPGAGKISEGGLIVALLLGLAAGVSTCLALTGGLVLALSAAFAAGRVQTPTPRRSPASDRRDLRDRPDHRLRRPGRPPRRARRVFPATGGHGRPDDLVAVLMTLLGVRLTGLSPRVAAWSPTLPTGLGRGWASTAAAFGLLGHPGLRTRRRHVLPALRVHPGRAGVRAVDRVAAGGRRDHGRLRDRHGARPARPRPDCRR